MSKSLRTGLRPRRPMAFTTNSWTMSFAPLAANRHLNLPTWAYRGPASIEFSRSRALVMWRPYSKGKNSRWIRVSPDPLFSLLP